MDGFLFLFGSQKISYLFTFRDFFHFRYPSSFVTQEMIVSQLRCFFVGGQQVIIFVSTNQHQWFETSQKSKNSWRWLLEQQQDVYRVTEEKLLHWRVIDILLIVGCRNPSAKLKIVNLNLCIQQYSKRIGWTKPLLQV